MEISGKTALITSSAAEVHCCIKLHHTIESHIRGSNFLTFQNKHVGLWQVSSRGITGLVVIKGSAHAVNFYPFAVFLFIRFSGKSRTNKQFHKAYMRHRFRKIYYQDYRRGPGA